MNPAPASPEDLDLAQALEALVAAKEAQKRRMRASAAAALLLAGGALWLGRAGHGWWAALLALGAIAAAVFAVKANLAADRLRNAAMETILAEAFRREGRPGEKTPPEA